LLAWYSEMLEQEFGNFNELKAVYGNASIVNNQIVVFNIKGNEYRLVVSINFRRKACYAIWFGTHKAYDKIDVATVSYDTNIDNHCCPTKIGLKMAVSLCGKGLQA